MLNVYFSDADGQPADICDVDAGPFYLSILYTSNSNRDINNFRIIADIVKKDSKTDASLDSLYINEFAGTIPSCKNQTCVITVPIPAIDFDCTKNEYYELKNPLAAWTSTGAKKLEDRYKCTDYPAAQCLNASTLPIEVGVLAYAFEPLFECYQQNINQTNISFLITSLFGGNPTQPYDIHWEFKMQDGTTIIRNEFSPVLLNNESGQIITATLWVDQGTLEGDTLSTSFTVPLAFTDEQVIENAIVTDSDEGKENGIIDIEFNDGDYFYYWTSVDDPEYYSEDAKIDSLPPGTYTLTTFDEDTGLCRTDIFEVISRILPVELIYFKENFNPHKRETILNWATAKEWENSHFEIERSVTGIEVFEKVGKVQGMGWKDTVTDYEYVDEDIPLAGGNILYRLKQVDYNGTFSYSEVLSVQASGLQLTKGVWRAFPNPTTGDVFRLDLLDNQAYMDEEIQVRLISPNSGNKVFKGSGIGEISNTLSNIFQGSPTGVYILEISWGQKVEHIKILKK